MRVAPCLIAAIAALACCAPLCAQLPGANPTAAPDSIEIVAKRKVKPGPLRIKLMDRPRPPQFGSENLRISYRVSNAIEGAQVFLRIRQGLQTHEWPLATHEDLTGSELETTTLVDVTGDTFAGQDVRVSLAVRDARGRTATSRSADTTVPQRFFLHPLSRQIASIRTGLINTDITVAEAKARLAELSEAARNANIDTTVQAALRQSYWRLEYDKSAAATFDLLWLTANHLESSRRLSVTTLAEQLDHTLSEKDIPMLPQQ